MTRDWTAAPTVGIVLLLLVVSTTGCGPRRDQESRDHDHDAEAHDEAREPAAEPNGGGEEHGRSDSETEEHGHSESEGEAGQVPLDGVRGVSFAVVGPPVEEGVWYPGEAMAAENERAMLSSPVEGVVTAIEVHPGREVAAGTPLLELRSPELAGLTASVLTRRATREQAAAELEREERLRAAGAGAERELEAARTALAVARAEETAALLALEARGISLEQAGPTLELKAPYRGRIATLDVLIGEGVASGQRLGTFETARASLVRLELPLPGPSTWSPGVTTTVRRGDGKTWPARLEGLPASLTPETRRLTYRLRLGGEDAPYPGTPLEVRVPLPPGIVVPQDAIQQIEGQWGVFVIEDDLAHFESIRRGPELGGDVIVMEGLAPGQRIATEGAYLLKALALKRSGGGEAHAH